MTTNDPADGLSAPDEAPAPEPLTVDIIVAGLEAEQANLTADIRTDADRITHLQGLNTQRRARLRQVKRMLTAAKPPKTKATSKVVRLPKPKAGA
jgi:hypothetical protein